KWYRLHRTCVYEPAQQGGCAHAVQACGTERNGRGVCGHLPHLQVSDSCANVCPSACPVASRAALVKQAHVEDHRAEKSTSEFLRMLTESALASGSMPTRSGYFRDGSLRPRSELVDVRYVNRLGNFKM